MKVSPEVFAEALRFSVAVPEASLGFRDGYVVMGRPGLLDPQKNTELLQYLEAWKPWRKGPFEVYGNRIEANWKSDRKWKRLKRILQEEVGPSPKNLRICDVGCNNGYFLFALQHAFSPKRLIGLDPTEEFFQCFCFLQNLSGESGSKIEYLPYGFQELIHFPNYFDVIVCMGVLYHQTDPVALLRILHGALKKGGLLVLESLSISGNFSFNEMPYSLVPAGRYAGMRGVWQVPTVAAIENWLRRTAFGKIQILEEHDYIEEQLRTEWGDLPALREALDPKDVSKTKEGYPAPRRAWFTARRG